jgi:hypothetical protein
LTFGFKEAFCSIRYGHSTNEGLPTKSGHVLILVWARFNKAYERSQNTGLYTQSATFISAGNRTFALPHRRYRNVGNH